MQAPGFIIHATGARGNMPDLGKRAYRLKCAIRVPNNLHGDELKRSVLACLEDFVRDMHLQGFEWQGSYGWRREGMPKPFIEAVTIRRPRRKSAKEMIRAVMQGARFLDNDPGPASTVPVLEVAEHWQYEVSGVFVHDAILTDIPDKHEERN